MTRVPWFVWTSLFAVTAILFGAYWDISWHMTIGRDSFWTPAHLAIQLGGIVAGLSGTYLIVMTTVRRDAPLRARAIWVWGFRGPTGAFLSVWGAAAMIVSAPFDNWWHNAYGLDVKILSPPHAVLTLGILCVAAGSVLQVVTSCNRADGALRVRLERVVVAIGGGLVVLTMTSILEQTLRPNLHRGDAYRAIAIVAPLMLSSMGTASGRRWGATAVAGLYTTVMVVFLWVFPLFSAEPKLGPVYQPITHFIPLEFPVLIVVPAIAIDLLRVRPWPRWLRALAIGIAFVVVLVAVEWPFAEFLQSELARNRVFGTEYFAYFIQPGWAEPRHVFFPETASGFATSIAEAVIAAVAGTWIGLVLGDAMRRIRR